VDQNVRIEDGSGNTAAFYGAEAQEEGVLGGSPRLAWDYVPLEESGKAFGQSFVARPPKNGV
jgi:hypothetical protein